MNLSNYNQIGVHIDRISTNYLQGFIIYFTSISIITFKVIQITCCIIVTHYFNTKKSTFPISILPIGCSVVYQPRIKQHVDGKVRVNVKKCQPRVIFWFCHAHVLSSEDDFLESCEV